MEGLAIDDDECLKLRGDGKSLMFTLSGLDALLGAAWELRKSYAVRGSCSR